MSEQELLVMSTKERDRLKVLHELKQGHLTQGVAALVKQTRWRPDVGYSAGRRSALRETPTAPKQ